MIAAFFTAALGWCKKQWKVCVGFFVGIFSIILLFRKTGDTAQIIEEKTRLNDKLSKAEENARKKKEVALQENLDNFFKKNKEIDINLKKDLEKVSDKKKEVIASILESEDPNDAIARQLKEFLKD